MIFFYKCLKQKIFLSDDCKKNLETKAEQVYAIPEQEKLLKVQKGY